ncbi:MAG: hypothetical protein GF398_18675 [Chitinivibrionales bacterium]|nr:hypothetical protein [Chitinivibrionales bacterium]
MKGSFVETLSGQTMNLDLTKTLGGKRNPAGLCTDIFLIIIRMREAEDLGAPESLRKLLKYFVELFVKNCSMISLQAEDIEAAKYALIALIDETVLSIPGECRDYWLSRPLQLDYFGNNIAGEEFYNKLNTLLMKFEAKKDIVEIYYICLSLGFEGRYKISNPQKRVEIMDEIGTRLKKLQGGKPPYLSPHAYFANSITKKSRQAPLVPVWLVSLIALLASGGWYAYLLLSNNAQFDSLLKLVQALTLN